MKKIVLHIGRHKTGTTAIQRFLCRNRDLLDANNLYYPKFGIRGFGHHELGAPLTRANLSAAGQKADEIVQAIRQKLDDEIHHQQAVIVISSESFQNCDPANVRKLFQGHEVTVVVYLREQISYLVSAYTQKVQATDYSRSIEEYHAENSSTNYQIFLDAWKREFKSRIVVRTYDRDELAFGNVVADFCTHALQLDGHTVNERCSEADANPSLTNDLLNFKLHINQHSTLVPEQEEKLYNTLAELAMTDDSGKIHVSKELRRRVDKHYRKSNAYVARHYFNRKRLFAPYDGVFNESPRAPSEHTVDKVRKRLVSLCPELSEALNT